MDYGEYVMTTMMKAGTKIVPFVVSVVVGYFVFIKLPFWFFRSTLRDARKADPEFDLPQFPEEPKVMRLEEKIKRDAEELNREHQKFQQQNRKTNSKKEQPKKEEPKREEPKREPAKRPATEAGQSPEALFELLPGQKFTPSELKSRYHELLKQSHPDRVASMGPDFKKLAEKKTKEINDAYSKLKKKAS